MTGNDSIPAFDGGRQASGNVTNTAGTRRVSESFVPRWTPMGDAEVIEEGQLSMTATQLAALPRPLSNVATEVGQCLPPSSLPGSRRTTHETSDGSGVCGSLRPAFNVQCTALHATIPSVWCRDRWPVLHAHNNIKFQCDSNRQQRCTLSGLL